jgi:hypothetical protein
MAVDDRTLELFDLLARGLIAAAAAVLALSVIGAIVIATSETALPVVDELQRQNRGTFAVGALGGGLTAAGVLSGLGAILRVLLAGWRERHPGA